MVIAYCYAKLVVFFPVGGQCIRCIMYDYDYNFWLRFCDFVN